MKARIKLSAKQIFNMKKSKKSDSEHDIDIAFVLSLNQFTIVKTEFE